ncbi:hypothetical protein EYF80_057086 [Liparis tanakae]|uniref:Uncharacterized protein n=1 Tax=Liparis tanakae TaxID=230148 RepID=A0A4Z2EVS4_9TELE|nr:hypothetical protein EYF80_057086 [Liparis tanakae]
METGSRDREERNAHVTFHTSGDRQLRVRETRLVASCQRVCHSERPGVSESTWPLRPGPL